MQLRSDNKKPDTIKCRAFRSELLLFGRCVGRRNGESVKRSQRADSVVQQSFVSGRKIAVGNNLSDIGCKLRKLGAVCVESVLFDRYECHDFIQLSFDLKQECEQCFGKEIKNRRTEIQSVSLANVHATSILACNKNCKQALQES
jgi:hypothetical protein